MMKKHGITNTKLSILVMSFLFSGAANSEVIKVLSTPDGGSARCERGWDNNDNETIYGVGTLYQKVSCPAGYSLVFYDNQSGNIASATTASARFIQPFICQYVYRQGCQPHRVKQSHGFCAKTCQ